MMRGKAAAAGMTAMVIATGAGECLGQGGHRERSAWSAAIGGIDLAEDFDVFGGDVEFREQPVRILSGMTFHQIGNTTLHEFRNFIDVPGFRFPDHNGTPHVSCWVDYGNLGETGIKVEITFERPLEAWGADFWGAATAEKLHVVPVSTRGVELGLLEATRQRSDEWEFMGFVAPPGEAIEKIILRSRRRFLGTVGEGFGMDNFALKYATAGGGCYPDCDTSSGPGVLDIFDFLCFQTRYDAQDPYACDCDTSSGTGVCDIFDFLCYQTRFDAGCP